MAENQPDYQVGQRGLNIVADPLTLPDGTLLKAENVEFVREGGIGGLASRAGLAPLNASALGAAVLAIVNIPIDTAAFGSSASGLLVALHPSAPVSSSVWLFSNDGAAFSVPTGLASMLAAGEVNSTVLLGQRQRLAVRAFESVFAVSYGTDLATVPPKLAKWDGTDASQPALDLPSTDGLTPPTSAPSIVLDVLAVGALLYFTTTQAGVGGPNGQLVRVFRFLPSSGVLTQIGNTIDAGGAGSGELAGGLAFAYGNLFLGISTSAFLPGRVYRILPDIETTWTLDETLPAGHDLISIGTFAGELYVGTHLTGGLSLIRKRTSAAVWSTSFTGASNDGYIGPLIEFDSKLFAGWWRSTGPQLLVQVFDGTSWTEDENLVTTFSFTAVTRFGQAVEFGGALYWSMPRPGAYPTENGSLLKRDTGGTWTAPISAARCVTGALAVVGP